MNEVFKTDEGAEVTVIEATPGEWRYAFTTAEGVRLGVGKTAFKTRREALATLRVNSVRK